MGLELRFEAGHFSLRSVEYDSAREEEVVAFCLFAAPPAGRSIGEPNARADTLFLPGLNQTPEQYLVPLATLPNGRFSLGCFSVGTKSTYFQQPFLPHYLLGLQSGGLGFAPGPPGSMEPRPSLCIGMGEIPDGLLMAETSDGKLTIRVEFRSDLWKFKSGPGRIEFPAPWFFVPGEDWYQATRNYFSCLIECGRCLSRKEVRKASFLPQFNTWGDQVIRGAGLFNFSGRHLESIYEDLKASGLKAPLLVVDAGWEEAFGTFRHCPERFPGFEAFLDRVRKDGREIGLWLAFARCTDVTRIGLDQNALLQDRSGRPVRYDFGEDSWYFFDPTRPAVERHLRRGLEEMLGRYRPKLLKLDFGYEIPPISTTVPADRKWAGERLFLKFLEIIAGIVRAVDPSIVIQYYSLSPLLNRYLDQLSLDDLFVAAPDFYNAFNKRAVLASLGGVAGLVPYGSSGYEWESTADQWLDSLIVGTPGCLAPLHSPPDPRLVAHFNGVSSLLRRSGNYRVEFVDADISSSYFSPRARSWLRLEEGKPVALVLRPGTAGEARYGEIVETTCPVALSLLEGADLGNAIRLGVVGLACGELRIRFPAARAARLLAHLLDGRVVDFPYTRKGDWIVIEAGGKLGGAAVEFLELTR